MPIYSCRDGVHRREPEAEKGEDWANAQVLIVALARTGDRKAFAELVKRRQSWVRNLMRRACGDPTLADDLAQQVFLRAWRNIRRLRHAQRFDAWLRRLAINTWLEHLRRHDALRGADELDDAEPAPLPASGAAIDLDRALATLSEPTRLCIVLSYHEGMTHEEIAEHAGLALGTVKSHIRRGTQRLQRILSDYRHASSAESPHGG